MTLNSLILGEFVTEESCVFAESWESLNKQQRDKSNNLCHMIKIFQTFLMVSLVWSVSYTLLSFSYQIHASIFDVIIGS